MHGSMFLPLLLLRCSIAALAASTLNPAAMLMHKARQLLYYDPTLGMGLPASNMFASSASFRASRFSKSALEAPGAAAAALTACRLLLGAWGTWLLTQGL